MEIFWATENRNREFYDMRVSLGLIETRTKFCAKIFPRFSLREEEQFEIVLRVSIPENWLKQRFGISMHLGKIFRVVTNFCTIVAFLITICLFNRQ